jgi:hypothetical protein
MGIPLVDDLDFNKTETKLGVFVLALTGAIALGYHLLRWGSFLLSTFVLPGSSVRLPPYLLYMSTKGKC